MRHAPSTRIAALALVFAGACAAAGPAACSRGVRIDIGRIDVRQHLFAGGSYQMPTIGVSNPGTEPTAYILRAAPLQNSGGREPPNAWFIFSPQRFTLKPGKMRVVRVRLSLPTNAAPGTYSGLLEAQIVDSSGAGAHIGAAAAARLRFVIAPSNFLQAVWLKVKTFFGDYAPYSYILPALALAVALGWRIRRRFSLRISVQRRT